MHKITFTILLLLLSTSISFSQWVFMDNATGKYGVKNKAGDEMIPAVYDEIIKLDRLNNFRAVLDNTAYFYNDRGELLNKVRFDELGNFEFNAACIKLKDKYGVVNEFGDITIPVIYDDLIWSLWSYAAVSKKGRWGIVTLSGNSITPIVYDTIIAFPTSVEYAIVKQNGKYGVVDMISGEVTHNTELDDFYFFKHNYIKSIKDGKVGLLHYDGTVLANPEYDDLRIEEDSRFAETYIFVKSGNKWGINNSRYGQIFPAEYDEIGTIDKKGIAVAQKDGKDILLDVRKGEIKTE